jgi:hypothetical protein
MGKDRTMTHTPLFLTALVVIGIAGLFNPAGFAGAIKLLVPAGVMLGLLALAASHFWAFVLPAAAICCWPLIRLAFKAWWIAFWAGLGVRESGVIPRPAKTT